MVFILQLPIKYFVTIVGGCKMKTEIVYKYLNEVKTRISYAMVNLFIRSCGNCYLF